MSIRVKMLRIGTQIFALVQQAVLTMESTASSLTLFNITLSSILSIASSSVESALIFLPSFLMMLSK